MSSDNLVPESSIYKIAIAFDHINQVNHEIHKGIVEYAKENPCFQFRYSSNGSDDGYKDLLNWSGHGAIIELTSPRYFKYTKEYSFPVVNISSVLKKTPHSRIRRDHFGVGEAAAKHLFQIGLENYGFIGTKKKWYSELQLEGMQHFLMQKGFDFQSIFVRSLQQLKDEEFSLKRIYDWMSGLEYPVGLFIDDDQLYNIILEISEKLNLSIPNDISIISLNNTEAAKIYKPALTSITFPNSEIGYFALKNLHKLILENNLNNKTDRVLKGVQIYPRESTNPIFTNNDKQKENVQSIKSYIEKLPSEISQHMSLDEAASRLNMSTKSFSSKFREITKTSWLQYVTKLRIQHACVLLERTSLNVISIAHECGFGDLSHFYRVFKKTTKLAPKEWAETRKSSKNDNKNPSS